MGYETYVMSSAGCNHQKMNKFGCRLLLFGSY